ncbi:MAG: hypothetical protein KC619_31575 [Myxococcales bacterium]|nr:hypothetical protein [Myxococcales bacterium]
MGDATSVDAGGPDAGPPPPRPQDLDLLLAIDGSNSVLEWQVRFVDALPALLDALSTGDVDGDGTAEGAPFASIQLAVVTSDMGTGGHPVPTCVDPDFGEDGILRTTGRSDIEGCMATYPPFLSWSVGEDLEAVSLEERCVAFVGTSGCGFEQPLEGMLKALSPAAPTSWTAAGYHAPAFFRDTRGHGDGVNAGFSREGAFLAVLMMTDEDDCSAADPDIYDVSGGPFGSVDLGRRCDLDDQLHPVARYVDGLLQLRPHPSQVGFFLVSGIPQDLEWPPGERYPWDRYDGDARDPRLVSTRDPDQPTRDLPSCAADVGGLAFAPNRLLEVAHGLDRAGGRVGLGSVCNDDYQRSFEAFARTLLAE